MHDTITEKTLNVNCATECILKNLRKHRTLKYKNYLMIREQCFTNGYKTHVMLFDTVSKYINRYSGSVHSGKYIGQNNGQVKLQTMSSTVEIKNYF